jgi:YidC/Oxa1 family membrane protein insertase
MMEKNRNYFIAIALSVVIVLAWQFLYMNPRMEAQQRALEAQRALQGESAQPVTPESPGATATGPLPGANQAEATQNREQAVAASPRVAIDTPALSGSINLVGARFRRPEAARVPRDRRRREPDHHALLTGQHQWRLLHRTRLRPERDVRSCPRPRHAMDPCQRRDSLGRQPGRAELHQRQGRSLQPDYLHRRALPDHRHRPDPESDRRGGGSCPVRTRHPLQQAGDPSVYVIHEGFIGVLGENGLIEESYGDVEEEAITNAKATGGWLGITDKYWAATLVPPQSLPFESRFTHFTDGQPRFQADFRSDTVTVEPGQSAEVKNLVFAGAKEVPLVDQYEEQYSIPRFELLIDWGWFYFITKPMFHLMDFFFRYFGNFGVAILMTTIVVKAIFFPLASKQYASMANMKRVQPKMEELKAKHGDDRMAMQQAMMQLYKEEKINPIAGCWPILLQIPVFFALYKVIYVTIEMRHAPFFGWIQDLSAPDPTSLFNLFGLLPYDVPSFLMIGVWPLIMGITMWLQMRMNPTPPDPTQAMIFNWMPLIFTFMLATFPAGLVIYWAWNNTLSIMQQALIMKRHGAKIELFDNIKGLFRRKPATNK